MTLPVYRKLHTPKDGHKSHTLRREALWIKGSQVDLQLSGHRPKSFCCMAISELGTLKRVAGIGHISVLPRLPEEIGRPTERQPKGVLGHPPSL